MKTKLALSLLLSMAVGGCMVGVDYKKPKTNTPAQFSEGHGGPTTQPAVAVDLTK